MCGRYLTPDEAAFERYWDLRCPPGFNQSFNVAPSQSAPVIRRNSAGDMAAELMTWGFKPAWATRAWINARAESVFSSRAFAESARRHRCLVAALGWYEWQGDAAPKQPYVLHREGFEPLAFAGIWTARETRSGWQRSFAIVTRPALERIATIHGRMPAVLRREDQAAWIAADTGPGEARALLAAAPDDIAAYRVSTHVNKPANDDPHCIEPAA